LANDLLNALNNSLAHVILLKYTVKVWKYTVCFLNPDPLLVLNASLYIYRDRFTTNIIDRMPLVVFLWRPFF